LQKLTLLTVLTKFRTNNLKGLGATLTLECDHIFVHGVTVEDPQRDTREALAARITSDVAAAADYEPKSVIVTLSEIPSDKMRVSARTP
jgi:phenylpyruvate tautomerase PptA (4-oxalocrotonate tautomerase family)